MYGMHLYGILCISRAFFYVFFTLAGSNHVLFSGAKIKDPRVDCLLWLSMSSSSADFTFQILQQCVPYSPLLTTSSDLVLFSVYFWDQTVFWSGGLALSSFCWGLRWKRSTGWHSVAPADGGSHGVSLAPCMPSCQIPPTVIQTRGSEKAVLCSVLALVGSLNNWKCLCSSLCTLLKLIYVQLFSHFPLQPLPLNLRALACADLGTSPAFFGIRGQI